MQADQNIGIIPSEFINCEKLEVCMEDKKELTEVCHSGLDPESINVDIKSWILSPTAQNDVSNRHPAFNEGSPDENARRPRLGGRGDVKAAFTLAEVLITLGIIGIVAAMTLPGLIQNYQKMVLKNQFKKSYAIFFNAIKQTQANLGSPAACYYWSSGGLCSEVCTQRDPVYNGCIAWTCADGSPLPPAQNGPRNDCGIFEEELFNNTFKVTKFCQSQALKNGCVTDDYRGTDKIKTEQNPDAEFPPNPGSDFSDNNIKKVYSSWVLADGTLIIKYGVYKSAIPIYTIDINGHKGPNKWGYDLFTFQLLGDNANGITKFAPIDYATEKGGIRGSQMLLDIYK